MKKIAYLLLFIAFVTTAKAQNISVKSFKLLENDLTATLHGTEVKDQNGQTCALIKVETLDSGFTFDFGLMAPMKIEQKAGEIWVYVPFGVKRVTISHSKLGVLRDWPFPMSIEKGRTYLMVLSTGETEEEITKQYLSFRLTPANAMLEVDGEIWPVSWDGTARKKVNEGTYTYVVQAKDYEKEEGEVTVADSATVVTVNLKAIPASAPSIEPTPVTPTQPNEKRMTFVTANLAYSVQPQWSYGFSVGQVKRFGWFVSFMTNGGFTGFGSLQQADANGFVDGSYLPMYNGKTTTDRLSVIVGGVMRVTGPLYARVGLGYGTRSLCWQDTNGQWYKMKDNSLQGVDVSAGLQLHLKGFVLSAEAVTTNFKTLEGKVGVGYAF